MGLFMSRYVRMYVRTHVRMYAVGITSLPAWQSVSELNFQSIPSQHGRL